MLPLRSYSKSSGSSVGEPLPEVGRAQRQRQLALELLVPGQHVALAGAGASGGDIGAIEQAHAHAGGGQVVRAGGADHPRADHHDVRTTTHLLHPRGWRARRLPTFAAWTDGSPSTSLHCGLRGARTRMHGKGDPGSTQRGVCATVSGRCGGARHSPLAPVRPGQSPQRWPAARLAPVTQLGERRRGSRRRAGPRGAHGARHSSCRSTTWPRDPRLDVRPLLAVVADPGRGRRAAAARRARPSRGRAPRRRSGRRGPSREASRTAVSASGTSTTASSGSSGGSTKRGSSGATVTTSGGPIVSASAAAPCSSVGDEPGHRALDA